MSIEAGKLLPATRPDGKLFVVPYAARPGRRTFLVGAGDDPNPTPPATGRGTGPALYLEWAAPGLQAVEFGFNEFVEMRNGELYWQGTWTGKDKWHFQVKIPANNPVPNYTGNSGNCNLVAVGVGMNLIVPAPNNDGTHDIDLGTAVPAPSSGKNGYWSVDENTSVVSASDTPGEAGWNLFDFEVASYIARNMPMGNPQGAFISNLDETEFIHPTWTLRLEVDRVSSGAGEISGNLVIYRNETV